MRREVPLREALSSHNTPFAKLIRQGQPHLSANDISSESIEITASKSCPYRMNRKLTPAEQDELVTQY